MKVLLLAENWPPRIGGIETYLTNIAAELQKAGDEVTVIAPDTSSNYSLPVTGYSLLRRRFFWPLVKPSWLPLYWYVKRVAKQEQIDVVLCGKGLFEGLVGHYLEKKLGIPYIVFTYAMEIEVWMKKRNTRRKLEDVISTAEKIIYINNVTRRKLEELGAAPEQLQKIQPGVEGRFLKPAKEQHVIQKYDLKKPYVLTVARLIPRKGIDDLIEAFSQLDQTKHGSVELVIAGDGPDAERLQQVASRSFVQPRFLGFVPHDDLTALFANAQLFALTPKNIDGDFEGFGIVYLEANATGVPVLATKSGGAGEAVIHKETGLLVEPGNVAEIKEAMEYILNHPADAKRMGDAGKKRAHEEFNWEKQAGTLRGSLEEIVSNK